MPALVQTAVRLGPGVVPRPVRLAKLMTGIELSRTALLLLAAAELSTGGFVLLRRGHRGADYLVNVRSGGTEHTSAAKASDPGAVTLALDRAVQWLQAARAAAALGP